MSWLLALLSVLPAWSWPLPEPIVVTRPFQPPATAYGPGHRGVDLAGVAGQPVRALGSGVVSVAGPLAGRGVVVVVHGSLRTTYEPLRARVHVGQPVAEGEVLGELQPGHEGCPRAACLHLGLLRGRVYLDPLSLLGRGRVRLLPLRGAGSHPAGPRPQSAGRAARSAAGSRAPEPDSSAGADRDRTTTLLAESGVAVGAGVALLRRTRRRVRATP